MPGGLKKIATCEFLHDVVDIQSALQSRPYCRKVVMRHYGHIESDRDEVCRIKRKASKEKGISRYQIIRYVEEGHMLGIFLLVNAMQKGSLENPKLNSPSLHIGSPASTVFYQRSC
jgi:hypothetical protein